MEPTGLAAIKPRAIRQRLDDEDALIELVSLLALGRIKRLVTLITDDVLISEPFSKAQTLRGKSEAEAFLKIAGLALRNMQCELRVCSCQHSAWRQMSAIFMFAGDTSCRILVRIEFGSQDPADRNYSRIRSIDIAFQNQAQP